MATGKYVACVNCRRVYILKNLEKERKEKGRENIVCPFCGSVNFTRNFKNVVLVIDPEKSKVAQELKIVHPGVYAYRFL